MTTPSPFVKWAGGKRRLLPHILPLVPASFGTYYEPFVGGGAVFFALGSRNSVLGDMNERLMRTYRAIKGSPYEVISCLQDFPAANKRFFDELKGLDIDSKNDVEVAAWMIFLNKTCFNGLYRINKRNRFNVAYDPSKDGKKICDSDNILSCSAVLQNCQLTVGRYQDTIAGIVTGDFVYFDPPYVPLSQTANFTGYTADDFGYDEQAELRDTALRLKNSGIHVLISNSSAPLVYELYKDFDIIEVEVNRLINCRADKRGAVKELLIK